MDPRKPRPYRPFARFPYYDYIDELPNGLIVPVELQSARDGAQFRLSSIGQFWAQGDTEISWLDSQHQLQLRIRPPHQGVSPFDIHFPQRNELELERLYTSGTEAIVGGHTQTVESTMAKTYNEYEPEHFTVENEMWTKMFSNSKDSEVRRWPISGCYYCLFNDIVPVCFCIV